MRLDLTTCCAAAVHLLCLYLPSSLLTGLTVGCSRARHGKMRENRARAKMLDTLAGSEKVETFDWFEPHRPAAPRLHALHQLGVASSFPLLHALTSRGSTLLMVAW